MVWLRAQNPQYLHLKTSVCTFPACVYVPDPAHTHVMWLLCSFAIKTIQNQLTVITARLLVNHLSQASDWSPSILPKWQFYSLFQAVFGWGKSLPEQGANIHLSEKWICCPRVVGHVLGWDNEIIIESFILPWSVVLLTQVWLRLIVHWLGFF